MPVRITSTMDHRWSDSCKCSHGDRSVTIQYSDVIDFL